MKKNILKIPQVIMQKLRTLPDDQIVVGCAIKIKGKELKAGKLNHLGITLTKKGLLLSDSVIPLETQGKYSNKNVNGEIIVRKDLPKERHYRSVETPNWGDAYNGTHMVDLPYDKYPREFDPPRELEIIITSPNTSPNQTDYIIAFKVNEVLNKKSKKFKKNLLENLNLLQENVGACGVESALIRIEEYAKTLNLSWEILPPGSREETIARLFKGRKPSIEEKEVAAERYDLFISLKPQKLVFGSSGFRRYFGALIEEDLVVFENMQYGNAIYVLFRDWHELSKKSRTELLSGKYETDFIRITHERGWKTKLREVIKTKRNQ